MEITALEFIAICLCWFCCGIAVKGCIDERRNRRTKDEVTIDGWVARDMDGELYLFQSKPARDAGFWCSGDGRLLICDLEHDSEPFPSVTWESEPKKVSVTIKAE